MAEGEAAITAKEYETWLTPSAAVTVLKHLHYSAARDTIIERAKFGYIKSAARRYNFGNKAGELLVLPATLWQDAEGSIHGSWFWSTGDITVEVPQRSGSYQTTRLALFGVRFDPAGIQELCPEISRSVGPQIAPQAARPDAEPATPAIEESPELIRGPPVSDALLRDWYELYRRAYPDTADTEPLAIESAKGMFPRKYVARRRVRELRGQRKPGRKPRQPIE
jgi:hypothetical protein